jgi:hypothetical protein
MARAKNGEILAAQAHLTPQEEAKQALQSAIFHVSFGFK